MSDKTAKAVRRNDVNRMSYLFMVRNSTWRSVKAIKSSTRHYPRKT